MKRFRLYIIVCLLGLTTIKSFSQEEKKSFTYSITNTAELQYNIVDKENRKLKGVNLLNFESSLKTDRFWKNGALDFSVWAVGESADERLIDDELTFSNIESENHFICSKLGYQHTFNNFTLFAGIRNLNIDYFTTPYSSLLTNSCSGIFPTISLNYGVPNYPFGGIGIHAEYNTKKISIKNSFYNNIKNINDKMIFNFQFDPNYYGYTNTSQVMYTSASGKYAIGSVLEKAPERKLNGSVFGLVEQEVATINKTQVGLIGQIGLANKNRNYCYSYWGIGSVLEGVSNSEKKDNLGIILYCANMQSQRETAIELTYQYPISSIISIQPTLHYIHNDNTNALVGLLRAILTLGN